MYKKFLVMAMICVLIISCGCRDKEQGKVNTVGDVEIEYTNPKDEDLKFKDEYLDMSYMGMPNGYMGVMLPYPKGWTKNVYSAAHITFSDTATNTILSYRYLPTYENELAPATFKDSVGSASGVIDYETIYFADRKFKRMENISLSYPKDAIQKTDNFKDISCVDYENISLVEGYDHKDGICSEMRYYVWLESGTLVVSMYSDVETFSVDKKIADNSVSLLAPKIVSTGESTKRTLDELSLNLPSCFDETLTVKEDICNALSGMILSSGTLFEDRKSLYLDTYNKVLCSDTYETKIDIQEEKVPAEALLLQKFVSKQKGLEPVSSYRTELTIEYTDGDNHGHLMRDVDVYDVELMIYKDSKGKEHYIAFGYPLTSLDRAKDVAEKM